MPRTVNPKRAMHTEINYLPVKCPFFIGWHHVWLVNNAGLGAWGASIFDTLYANGPSIVRLSLPLQAKSLRDWPTSRECGGKSLLRL